MASSTAFDHWIKQGLTSLQVGAPDKDLLKACFKIINDSTQALNDDANCLQYGADLGDRKALEELAKFLSHELKDEVNVDNLMFNAGATQGLIFLINSFFSEGDLAIVEDPTYFLALRALKGDAGLNVVPVSSCEDGVNVDELDAILEKHIGKEKQVSSDKPFSALVYLIPTFNNPLGTCLTEDKSNKLIKVLRKHKALAICDDVYNLCYFMDEKAPFTTPSPKRLAAFDKKTDPDYYGNVVSNGTFSKFMGPGLRLGWFEAPKHVLDVFLKTGYVKSGGCFNQFTACVMREAMKQGLVSEHLAMLRQVYHSRMDAMCSAIERLIPTAKVVRPKGGIFIWVRFPEELNVDKVLEVWKVKHKVFAINGRNYSSVGNFTNCIRLGFAHFPEKILVDCIEKLRLAVDEVINNHL